MTDTIKIHKLINNELVPLEMLQKRFEQTMDRIDLDVEKGASKAQILEKYSDYIVASGKKTIDKTTTSTQTANDAPELTAAAKKEIVQQAVNDNPNMTLGEIIKHVSAQHPLTAANVRYIASKIMK